jgi:hypothetical protein
MSDLEKQLESALEFLSHKGLDWTHKEHFDARHMLYREWTRQKKERDDGKK